MQILKTSWADETAVIGTLRAPLVLITNYIVDKKQINFEDIEKFYELHQQLSMDDLARYSMMISQILFQYYFYHHHHPTYQTTDDPHPILSSQSGWKGGQEPWQAGRGTIKILLSRKIGCSELK